MTKEEKQILLKDLCARLPYRVIMNVDVLNIDCLLCAVYQNKEHPDCIGIGDNGIASIERVKPYLRPMSSMTEEEKEERNNIVTTVYDGTMVDDEFINVIKYVDWLYQHHFDVRGLIPMGLAIEAPADMYP